MFKQDKKLGKRRAYVSVAMLGVVVGATTLLALGPGCPGLDGTAATDGDLNAAEPYAVEADHAAPRAPADKTGTMQQSCTSGSTICDRSIGPMKCMLNVFGSGHIQNKSIQSWDLADNAVGSRVLAGGSVGTNHIANAAITSEKLDNNLSVWGNLEVGNDIYTREDREGHIGNTGDAWEYLYTYRVLPGTYFWEWKQVGSNTRPFNEMYSYAYNAPSISARWEGGKTLGRDDYSDILASVEAASVATFFLREELQAQSRPDGESGDPNERIPRTAPYLGVNAETLPPEVLDGSGTAVNLSAHTAMLHAAVKELSTRIREQRVEIDELRRRLDALEQMR